MPVRRRALALALLALVPALAAAGSGASAGRVILAEDFESGLDGWLVEPVAGGVVCAGEDGCAFRLWGSPAENPATARRALDATPLEPVALAVRFRGSDTHGHVDASIRLELDRGFVMLGFTDGAFPKNNELSLHVSGLQEPTLRDERVPERLGWLGYAEPYTAWREMGEWEAGRWYTFVLHADPLAHAARVEVLDDAGALVAASPPAPLAREATRVVGVSLSTQHYHGATTWVTCPCFDLDDVVATEGRV